MLLLAGHVPHEVVHELVHLLHVLGELRLVLETHRIKYYYTGYSIITSDKVLLHRI